MQLKYALKIIKYLFLAYKNIKICPKKFIIIHNTKILYFYYLVGSYFYLLFFFTSI